jgi:putative membrane protein
MEKKLLKYIMNPSFIITFISGLTLVIQTKQYNERWFIIKFLLVIFMSIFHMYCAKTRISFEKMLNEKDEKYFRIINEIPTILFLGIVALVVFKPFN